MFDNSRFDDTVSVCNKYNLFLKLEDWKNKILLEEISNKDLPIVYNLNIGHATPRCIIPFDVEAEVDVGKQVIVFYY